MCVVLESAESVLARELRESTALQNVEQHTAQSLDKDSKSRIIVAKLQDTYVDIKDKRNPRSVHMIAYMLKNKINQYVDDKQDPMSLENTQDAELASVIIRDLNREINNYVHSLNVYEGDDKSLEEMNGQLENERIKYQGLSRSTQRAFLVTSNTPLFPVPTFSPKFEEVLDEIPDLMPTSKYVTVSSKKQIVKGKGMTRSLTAPENPIDVDEIPIMSAQDCKGGQVFCLAITHEAVAETLRTLLIMEAHLPVEVYQAYAADVQVNHNLSIVYAKAGQDFPWRSRMSAEHIAMFDEATIKLINNQQFAVIRLIDDTHDLSSTAMTYISVDHPDKIELPLTDYHAKPGVTAISPLIESMDTIVLWIHPLNVKPSSEVWGDATSSVKDLCECVLKASGATHKVVETKEKTHIVIPVVMPPDRITTDCLKALSMRVENATISWHHLVKTENYNSALNPHCEIENMNHEMLWIPADTEATSRDTDALALDSIVQYGGSILSASSVAAIMSVNGSLPAPLSASGTIQALTKGCDEVRSDNRTDISLVGTVGTGFDLHKCWLVGLHVIQLDDKSVGDVMIMTFGVTMHVDADDTLGKDLVGERQADGSSLFRVEADHLLKLIITNLGKKTSISLTYVGDSDEEEYEPNVQLRTGEVYTCDPLIKNDGDDEDSWHITYADKTTSTFRFTLTHKRAKLEA